MADTSKKNTSAVIIILGILISVFLGHRYMVYLFELPARSSSIRESTTQPVPFDAERREQVRNFVADEIDRQTGRSLQQFNALASAIITAVAILIAVAFAIFGFSWWRQAREHKEIIDKAEKSSKEIEKYREAIKDDVDKIAKDGERSKKHLEQIKKDRQQISKELEEVKHLRESTEESAQSAKSNRHFAQALAYESEGKLDRAIEEYGRSIASEESLEAYNNCGVALTKIGEFDKALANYDKAIELDPDNATIYLNRGAAWAKKGEFNNAIADYKKAFELDPKYAIAYRNAAEALITLKRDFRRAVERLEQGKGHNAFESNRDRLFASCLEGIALALNGDDASAAEAEAKRLLAGGAKASGWDTEPMERFLKDLKAEDFDPAALETARRINEMLKIK